jgi:hypothetical protein
MSKKTLMIFPCSERELSLVDYISKRGEYEKIFLVIPSGDQVCGLYWQNMLEEKKDTIYRVHDWREDFDKCDSIWIPGDYHEHYLKKEIEACVEKAKIQGIPVFRDTEESKKKECYGKETQELYKPNATIIAVGECFEDFNGIDVLCTLANALRMRDVQTVIASERNLSWISGFCQIPVDIRNNNLDGVSTIMLWNRYLRYLDETVSPDIIIVQVPGGMMQFPRKNWDAFELRAYYFFQAVCPDMLLVTVPFNMADEQSIGNMATDFNCRYGVEPDQIFLSNRIIDFSKFFKDEGVGKQYVDMHTYKENMRKRKSEDIWNWEQIEQLEREIEREYLRIPFELVTLQL